jgi:hypothetical protein
MFLQDSPEKLFPFGTTLGSLEKHAFRVIVVARMDYATHESNRSSVSVAFLSSKCPYQERFDR